MRASVFYLVAITSLLVYVPLALLISPLPYTRRYRILSTWTRLNLATLEHVCGLRYTVEGTENIPDETAIIFSKHQSAWETMALQRIFPPHVWVLKRELLRLPLFGWGISVLRPISIDRRSGRKAVQQIVEQGTERLRAGIWVMIFPEGTRTAPGQRGRYGIGGAVLAEQSGFPVVPVAHNAGEFWPRNSFLKRPGTIRVVIGPPIRSTGRDAAEIRDLAEAWIEGTMETLSG